jgi:hypothetical protein
MSAFRAAIRGKQTSNAPDRSTGIYENTPPLPHDPAYAIVGRPERVTDQHRLFQQTLLCSSHILARRVPIGRSRNSRNRLSRSTPARSSNANERTMIQ